MINETSAAYFRRNFDELLNGVLHRHESVVINKNGKPVAALVDVRLFERIRRMESRFEALCKRIEIGYSNVPEAEGFDEVASAVRIERSTVRRSPKQR